MTWELQSENKQEKQTVAFYLFVLFKKSNAELFLTKLAVVVSLVWELEPMINISPLSRLSDLALRIVLKIQTEGAPYTGIEYTGTRLNQQFFT